MKKYSKCAIYSLEQFENSQGQKFYNAVLVENTYNPKIPYANKWEMTMYKCQIYTEIELETANFDLELDKNKLSFINISNPEKSIIRVLDFEYVNRTQWRGKTQIKNDMGKATYKQYIAIYDLEYDKQGYKTEERKLVEAEQRCEKFKQTNNDLRKEITKLKKELAKREQEILDKNEKINSVEITYNPKFNSKVALPTNDDMVEFEDI